MAFGDDRGNRAGTLDLISRITYESKLKYSGYYVFAFEFERAGIANGYSRYGAAVGYTFSEFLGDDDFELTPLLSLGNISRQYKNSISWAGSVQFAFLVNDKIKIGFINQLTQRSDLKKTKSRYSFFLGLQIRLNKFNE